MVFCPDTSGDWLGWVGKVVERWNLERRGIMRKKKARKRERHLFPKLVRLESCTVLQLGWSVPFTLFPLPFCLTICVKHSSSSCPTCSPASSRNDDFSSGCSGMVTSPSSRNIGIPSCTREDGFGVRVFFGARAPPPKYQFRGMGFDETIKRLMEFFQTRVFKPQSQFR